MLDYLKILRKDATETNWATVKKGPQCGFAHHGKG